MIEIAQNIRGEITVKETEDAKGIGTFWFFTDLQDYIEKNRVNKEELHHLCKMSILQMERMECLTLKESEKFRLCSDLERLITRLYYAETKRNFTIEYNNGMLEFKEDGSIIQRLTFKRYQEDLKEEPDPVENAKQFINFALESKRLTDDERKDLIKQLVEIYEFAKQEYEKQEELKKLEKKNKKKQ